MKLHRDIGVSYKTAWFMQQRIRQAFAAEGPMVMAGPVEIDETYMGGLEKNRHAKDRKNLGRGPVGKTAVVGAKDRRRARWPRGSSSGPTGRRCRASWMTTPARTRHSTRTTRRPTRGRAGITKRSSKALPSYIRYLTGETVHTNGVESFWSMLKRAHKGTFHRLSPKHLQRYVNEFCGRHNIRVLDMIRQMEHIVAPMVGKRLMYRDLIADNTWSAVAS